MKESTNMKSSKEVLSIIVERLKSEDFLNDFEYHISSKAFVYKTPGEKLIVELDPYTTDYLISCDGDKPTVKDIPKSIVIRPCISRRFEIIHRWYEKFSFRSLRDQRNSDSIGFASDMLGFDGRYFFHLDLLNFEEQYNKVVHVIKDMCSFMNSFFRNLEQLYYYKIVLVMEGKRNFPDGGAEWLFRDLALTKIVSPNDYPIVKSKALEHIEIMHNRHEPNIERYYPNKLFEIFNYLERYNFKYNESNRAK